MAGSLGTLLIRLPGLHLDSKSPPDHNARKPQIGESGGASLIRISELIGEENTSAKEDMLRSFAQHPFFVLRG